MYKTSPLTHVDTGITFQSHAAYDDTPAGVRSNRTARYEKWRDLVQFQCRLIADICARQHQVVSFPEPDVNGQYELFGKAS